MTIDSFQGEYRFLSNFFRSPVVYNNEYYPTGEHAYQAAKCTNKYDHDMVQAAFTAGKAKRLGLTMALRKDWEQVKYNVMYGIVKAKFSQVWGMRERLLATGDAELIEGNDWGDVIWGVCDGVGTNWLGKILMQVRSELQPKTVMKTVFLGGTCNGSQWRDDLIPSLKISHYNPVVPNWTPECQAEELKQRETCDICLYCITPKMTGIYSIAEAVDDSNKRPKKVVFAVLEIDGEQSFTVHQVKSLKQTAKMIESNGGRSLVIPTCADLGVLASLLNTL